MGKRICICVGSISCGGAERMAVNIANDLVSLGNEVYILILDNKKSLYAIDERITVVLFEKIIQNKILKYFQFSLHIRKSLKKINPDAVLDFIFPSFFLLSTIGLKYKTVISIRNNPNNMELFDKVALRKMLFKRAKAIISQTEYARKVIFEQTKHSNIVVIPNYVRNIAIENTEKENQIINVGKLHDVKGQEKLIRMFSEIPNDGWKLILVGDGPNKEKLMNQCQNLSVSDKVIFTGNVDNVDHYLQQSKIFAFTSQTEGFPNALLEAMATPLACISFDCLAGPSEMIKDNENGFLVPLNDENEFKQKLLLLMNDENRQIAFSTEALKVKEAFSKEVLLGKIKEVLLN
ncbi:MAG: glycosyltransferase family 4 protein [Flavobacterium sp.]